MSKSPNKKKAGGSDLDHTNAVSSSGKNFPFACLCVCVCVPACTCVCVGVCMGVCVGGCLSVCQPCSGLPQTYVPLCLKYDLFRVTILYMLSVDKAFCESLYFFNYKNFEFSTHIFNRYLSNEKKTFFRG